MSVRTVSSIWHHEAIFHASERPECPGGVGTESSGSEIEVGGGTSEDEARRRASTTGGLMDIFDCWFSSHTL